MKLSLRTKFLILGGLVQILVVCLLIWNSLRLLDDAINQNAYRVAREYAVTLNLSLSPYASSGRLPQIQSHLSEMLSEPRDGFARYIVILDASGRALVSVGDLPPAISTVFRRVQENPATGGLKTQQLGPILHASAPLLLSDNKVGSLNFGLSTADLLLAKQSVLTQGLVISIAGFALALVLFYALTIGIGRRLYALTVQSHRLAQGEFGELLPEQGGDEIEVFARSLNQMSLALRERIAQLDVSERHLAESEERFKILFEMAPVPLVVTDKMGMVIDINLALVKSFGHERAVVIGKTSADIAFWETPEERARIWRIYEHEGAVQGVIAKARLANGGTAEVSIWSSSLTLGGEQAIIWALLDLSEELKAKRALYELNLSLEDRVKQRSAQLEQANKELSSAMEALKRAQADLITAEKMASLGSLVAGVAHELNTPIGNSLLGATALCERSLDFEKILLSEGIKRSALLEYLSDTREGCTLIAGSLHKAADLVASFKQVAVDQSSDQRRVFELREVLQDTLATFSASLKTENCEVCLEVPSGITLDSYPGSIVQIVNNLIKNALMHAFDQSRPAIIELRAYDLGNDNLELTFKDNGIGMSAEILRHVFDPFFTTKMGRGGTGLGMNIVYNIVTGLLGGSIVLESRPGQGTLVKISLPKTSPLRERRKKADR